MSTGGDEQPKMPPQTPNREPVVHRHHSCKELAARQSEMLVNLSSTFLSPENQPCKKDQADFRVLMFEKLQPITELSCDAFWKAYWEIVRCKSRSVCFSICSPCMCVGRPRHVVETRYCSLRHLCQQHDVRLRISRCSSMITTWLLCGQRNKYGK